MTLGQEGEQKAADWMLARALARIRTQLPQKKRRNRHNSYGRRCFGYGRGEKQIKALEQPETRRKSIECINEMKAADEL